MVVGLCDRYVLAGLSPNIGETSADPLVALAELHASILDCEESGMNEATMACDVHRTAP